MAASVAAMQAQVAAAQAQAAVYMQAAQAQVAAARAEAAARTRAEEAAAADEAAAEALERAQVAEAQLAAAAAAAGVVTEWRGATAHITPVDLPFSHIDNSECNKMKNRCNKGEWDRGGVLYHIGSRGGLYVNPALSGMVSVAFSSTAGGSQSIFNLVSGPSRDHERGSEGTPEGWVGSGYSCNTNPYPRDDPRSWMSVDLGPRRALAVTHYALRADMNGAYGSLPRSWELQGSVLPSDSAMAEWVTLRRHDGDESLDAQNWAVAAWAVTRNNDPFRSFRVLQHACGAGGNKLHCGGMELWGQLRDAELLGEPEPEWQPNTTGQ